MGLGIVSLGANVAGGEVRAVPVGLPREGVYVRQAVVIRMSVEGEERPVVGIPPRGRDRFVRSAPRRSGGEWVVTLAYVPDRTGKQWIPGVEVRSGDAVVRTVPTPVDVRAVPMVGRPERFRGGVGGIEAGAEVDPDRVTVGDRFVYRVRLSGPGAIGTTGAVDAGALSQEGVSVVGGPEVERSAEPAEARFEWTLRALQAGSVRIPASTIASFDPDSRRFLTRVIPGAGIEVRDAAGVDVGEVLAGSSSRGPAPGRRGWWVAGVAVVLSVGLVGVWMRRRWARVARPWRIAAEQARGLERLSEGEEVARRILKGLAVYLEAVSPRERGVLTPPEAVEAIGDATGQAELSVEAGRLVGRCDRVLYGDVEAGSDLKEEAIRFFRALGEVRTGG